MYNLQQEYEWSKYLKPRKKEYMFAHINNFYVAKVSSILVWSIELSHFDKNTLEIGAFIVSGKKLCKDNKIQVAKELVDFSISYADEVNKTLISVTNNRSLQDLMIKSWFEHGSTNSFMERKIQSPGIDLFLYEF